MHYIRAYFALHSYLICSAAVVVVLYGVIPTFQPATMDFGRVYAAYGGVYVATALVWLRVVDGVKLSAFDWIGASVVLLGMAIIVAGWRS